jgi:hypothetical protein
VRSRTYRVQNKQSSRLESREDVFGMYLTPYLIRKVPFINPSTLSSHPYSQTMY